MRKRLAKKIIRRAFDDWRKAGRPSGPQLHTLPKAHKPHWSRAVSATDVDYWVHLIINRDPLKIL